MAAFKSEKAVQGFIKAAINLKKFKKNQELNSKQTGLINGRIVKFSVLALDTNLNNIKEFFKVKKRFVSNGLEHLDLKFMEDSIYKTLGTQYNRSALNYFIYRKVQMIVRSLKLKL